MLENIKMLLGIDLADTSKDGIIQFHISSVTTKILNYINQDSLPQQLQHIVIELVVEKMNDKDKVKSIARGDTTITYSDANYNKMTGAGGADFLKDYKGELNKFRKVKCI